MIRALLSEIRWVIRAPGAVRALLRDLSDAPKDWSS